MKQPDNNQVRTSTMIFAFLFFAMIFSCHKCKSQDTLSFQQFKERVTSIEQIMIHQDKQIQKFDKQSFIGQQLFCYGGLLVAGGWCTPNTPDNRSMKVSMVITGVALDIAAMIVIFDARKYLTRSSRVQINSNGVSIFLDK